MKYLGGKTRLSKDIIPILEEIYNEEECKQYIEPCVGGANMIDKVTFTKIKKGYDINEYMIDFWKAIQNGWEPPHITREQYYEVKNNIEIFPSY